MVTIEQTGISKILIATDGSVYPDAAFECGAWLASRTAAQVTAMYVIDARRLAGHFIKHFSEIISSREHEGFTDRVRDYYRSHGKETLERAPAICEPRGVACRARLDAGNVVRIVGCA